MDNQYWTSKVKVIEGKDLETLESELNCFFEGKFIVSSPVIAPKKKGEPYICLVYYKIPPERLKDNNFNKNDKFYIKDPDSPITPAQKGLLERAKKENVPEVKDLNINSMTKQQASVLISELKEKYG